MFRAKRLWALVAAVVVVSVGGYLYYTQVYAADRPPDEQRLQTATVRRGSIVISPAGARSRHQ